MAQTKRLTRQQALKLIRECVEHSRRHIAFEAGVARAMPGTAAPHQKAALERYNQLTEALQIAEEAFNEATGLD